MNDAQHIERVLQDAVDESDFDCIALSGGLDSTILAHLASSKNPLALAVAADGFDASDLEFSKLAAKNCNLNLKLLRPDADELADAARKTADILGNFNDIEIRNATVMYVLLSNAKKLGMHKVMTGDGADELFAGYKFMRKLNPEKLQSELDRVYSVMHFTSQIIAKRKSQFLSENVIKLQSQLVGDLCEGLASDRAYTPASLARFIGLCNYIKSSLIICDIHHNLESNIDEQVCKECENMLLKGPGSVY